MSIAVAGLEALQRADGGGPVMETGDDFLGEAHLVIPGIGALFTLALPALDGGHGLEAEQFHVAPHQFIGDRHQLAEHLVRRLGDADIVVQRLGHFLHAVQPFQDRHGQHDLRRLAIGFLHLAPDQQVELLIGAAQLDIGLHGHGVIALDQRIQEFMDGDRLPALVAVAEILALQHAGDGMLGGQTDQFAGAHGAHPATVEHDQGLFRMQNLENLLLVGFGVLDHLVAGKRLAGHILARGVADHAGEITDQEHRLMAQFLELLHFVEQHGMPQVQIGGGGVESGLDAERPALGQALDQRLFRDELGGASFDDFQGFSGGRGHPGFL